MSQVILTVSLVIGRPAASARAIAALILRWVSEDISLLPSAHRGLLFAASSLRKYSGSSKTYNAYYRLWIKIKSKYFQIKWQMPPSSLELRSASFGADS